MSLRAGHGEIVRGVLIQKKLIIGFYLAILKIFLDQWDINYRVMDIYTPPV